MDQLCAQASLAQVQDYVRRLEIERGFTAETAVQKCLLLGEEVGELFKAVRKAEGIPVDSTSGPTSIAHELADVLIYVCEIANRYGVDLEAAFRAKEEINARRTWSPAVSA